MSKIIRKTQQNIEYYVPTVVAAVAKEFNIANIYELIDELRKYDPLEIIVQHNPTNTFYTVSDVIALCNKSIIEYKSNHITSLN